MYLQTRDFTAVASYYSKYHTTKHMIEHWLDSLYVLCRRILDI